MSSARVSGAANPWPELIVLRQWAAPARALHRPALASVALMERLAAPPAGVELIAIAPPPLRGKSAPLELVALAMEDTEASARRMARA